MSSLNFKQLMNTAKESDMEPLPETTGHFKVIKSTVGETGTGKDKITVKLQSMEGSTKGRSFSNQFVISPDSPNALYMFFRQMEAFGLSKDGFFASDPSLDKVAKTLLNRYVWVKVVEAEWQGRKKNEIAEIAAPRDPQLQNSSASLGDPLSAPLPPEPSAPAPPAPPAPEPEAQASPDDSYTEFKETETPPAPPAPPAPPTGAAEAPPEAPF